MKRRHKRYFYSYVAGVSYGYGFADFKKRISKYNIVEVFEGIIKDIEKKHPENKDKIAIMNFQEIA